MQQVFRLLSAAYQRQCSAFAAKFENVDARIGILFGDVNGTSGVTRGLSQRGQT